MKTAINKKGFTVVEIVIVIAVIAILAAVLIPTFSSVITKAKLSSAQQKARNALSTVIFEKATSGTVEVENKENGDTYGFLVEDKYWFTATVGAGSTAALSGGEEFNSVINGNNVKMSDGKYKMVSELNSMPDIEKIKVVVFIKKAD